MPRKPLAQSRELPIILGAVGTIPRRSPVCAGKRRKVQTFLKKPKSLNFWCAETAPHKTGIWAASKLMFKRSVQNGLLWLHQSVNQRAGARNLFRLVAPLGCFPARRSFLFSWRRNSRLSIFSGVYSKPFWFSTRARRARHILANP